MAVKMGGGERDVILLTLEHNFLSVEFGTVYSFKSSQKKFFFADIGGPCLSWSDIQKIDQINKNYK